MIKSRVESASSDTPKKKWRRLVFPNKHYAKWSSAPIRHVRTMFVLAGATMLTVLLICFVPRVAKMAIRWKIANTVILNGSRKVLVVPDNYYKTVFF